MFDIPLSVARHAMSNGLDRTDLESMRDEGDSWCSLSLDWRYIHSDVIDDVLVEELEQDPYYLAIFNPDFLSAITGLSEEIIKLIQKAEAFRDFGQWIIDQGLVNDLAEQYVSADGYGHHFAHYDGETVELTGGWLAFRLG